MPLIPTGLTAGLFDRIKQRVNRELGGQDESSAGFMTRVKDLVKEQLGLSAPPDEQPPPVLPQGPPSGIGDIMQRIQEAGRAKPPLMLSATYNGHVRLIEPYSFRFRDSIDPHIPLLYAFCHKDNGLEAFHLKKFTDLQVTDRPFQPRWVVEFGSNP